MITRDQLEASVEEVSVGDKFTGQFRVNYDTLVDVDKCVRMAKVLDQTFTTLLFLEQDSKQIENKQVVCVRKMRKN